MKPPTSEGDAVAGPSAGASLGGGAAEPQSFGQHHLIWKAQQAKRRIHSVRNDWGGRCQTETLIGGLWYVPYAWSV